MLARGPGEPQRLRPRLCPGRSHGPQIHLTARARAPGPRVGRGHDEPAAGRGLGAQRARQARRAHGDAARAARPARPRRVVGGPQPSPHAVAAAPRAGHGETRSHALPPRRCGHPRLQRGARPPRLGRAHHHLCGRGQRVPLQSRTPEPLHLCRRGGRWSQGQGPRSCSCRLRHLPGRQGHGPRAAHPHARARGHARGGSGRTRRSPAPRRAGGGARRDLPPHRHARVSLAARASLCCQGAPGNHRGPRL
mmetsp:Transcript_2056/g.5758  ORF Transcript_2056/g.5758 Transcript_2056/m.5758 type:complete len:250 (+) Transcript_2056:950-1699(+)